MRAVTGPRVQLLCVDASPRLLVFGSSIGSVYVFERRARGGEALDADAEPDAANADAHDSSPVASHAPEDGPARFLERFMVETFAGGSATRPVTRARLDERRARVALAFDDGEVVVTSFRDPLSSDALESSSGRYVAGIPNGHKGARVTSMAWSGSGDALISGDDAGAVSVVRLDGPDAGARTVRFDAPVVQAAFCDFGGGAALVSTTTQLSLLHRANGFKKTPIGAKPRDGAFGASAHAWTRAAVPEETLAQLEAEEAGTTETTEGLFSSATEGGDAKGETKLDEKSKRATRTPCRVRSEYWMFGARPGRRLWVCRAATAGELSEAKVLATVRPSIPEASAPPGSRLPAPTAPVPKKWEFGALHALGPCVLSVSEKAIAVVDVVSAAVLAWYPLAPPREGTRRRGRNARNAEGVGAPRDLVTRGARAFALGADGGVWCLRAPANEAQLAAASAALGVLAARRGDVSRDDGETSARERRRARRIRRRIWNASRDEYGPSTVRADRRRRHRPPRREMRRAMSILRGVASAFFLGAAPGGKKVGRRRFIRRRASRRASRLRARDARAAFAVDRDRVHHARAQRALTRARAPPVRPRARRRTTGRRRRSR